MWIVLKCYYIVDLILDSISVILVSYCKFWAFRIFLFYISYFQFFVPNIHNKIIDISSFQTGLNVLFSSTGFYIKSKVIECSIRGKICLLIFGHFLPKCTFLRLWHFFHAWWLSSQLSSSVEVHIYKIHVFDEAFYLLLSEFLWLPNFSG